MYEMYVCICMYAYMYLNGSVNTITYACVCTCMYVCMFDVCMYLCMYVCMYVCIMGALWRLSFIPFLSQMIISQL